MITAQTNKAIKTEIITFKISSFLNPSRKLRIKKSQEVSAKKGTINVIAEALTKEFNFLAYLKAKKVVATDTIEKKIPSTSATICDVVIQLKSNIYFLQLTTTIIIHFKSFVNIVLVIILKNVLKYTKFRL